MSELLTALAAGAGVPLGPLPATAPFSQVVPCFMLTPGQSWLQGLERLAQLYLFTYRTDAGGVLQIADNGPADPVTWSYADEVLESSLRQSADQATVIRVVGAGPNGAVFADVVDTARLAADGGRERYLHLVDRLLDTAAKCLLRAQRTLLAEQRANTSGAVRAVINPAHERGDVITLADPLAGAATLPLRITGIRWQADANSGLWEQELQLGGV